MRADIPCGKKKPCEPLSIFKTNVYKKYNLMQTEKSSTGCRVLGPHKTSMDIPAWMWKEHYNL
jgi:hypothetical protein